MSDNIVVLVTASNEDEAAKIARTLVEERLAACANIIRNIRSIYRWEGEVQDDPEVLMVIKTRKELFGRIEKRVRELHSYDVPEVISLDITEGSEPYIKWLSGSTM